MKLKMLSVYSKILSFFLVLLGFSSCDSVDPVDEYGVPIAKFKIRGTVVDESDKPITKIKTVLGKPSYATLPDKDGYVYHYVDSILTDKEGKFELIFEDVLAPDKFLLKIEDVDGDENGVFETRIDTVEFKNPTFTGGSGWDRGTAVKDVEVIKMTSVKKD